ncbi:Dirigent protein 9 [Vitis vinifera]|uniref:Dirigent protein n=1 Tax=Vitis vinifera TaxID=29760 RepID=A0A438EP88_VITVI|nr:Dirigent protein 9 [Vitis vinifera]
MATTPFLLSKTIIYLLLLAITLGHVSSARILDEVDPQPPVIPDPPEADDSPAIVPGVAPVLAPTNTLPSGQIPATASSPTEADDEPPLPEAGAPDAVPVDVAPVAGPVAALPSGPAPVAATSATTGNAAPPNPPLSFFMHDILGGSHPSARVVSGITANTQINGLPFSKANGGVFPINGGVPLLNGNNGLINNNNIPFLTGLNGGQTSTIIQNNGNNNPVNGGSNQPFVTAGQLPAEPPFRSDHHQEEDTISFFGVHRTASPVSHIAVVGGTGEYENAKGYATIESLHQEDQHTTDGVETVIQVNVYLSH